MRLAAGGLIAALVAGSIFPASAGQERDAAAIEACIRSAPPTDALQGAGCVGMIAGPCQDESGGAATAGIVQCLQRERDAWDFLLNRYYQALRKSEPEPARSTLRDTQRAWIAFRDKDCQFAYEQFLGGSMRLVAGAACERDRTAERVLHLWAYSNFGN